MESCAEFSGGIFGGQLEKPSFSWGLSQKERANGLGDRPNGHQQVSWVFLFKYTAAFLPVIVGLQLGSSHPTLRSWHWAKSEGAERLRKLQPPFALLKARHRSQPQHERNNAYHCIYLTAGVTLEINVFYIKSLLLLRYFSL